MSFLSRIGWLVFLFKSVVTAVIVFGISFGVANFVSEKTVKGFDSSVASLNASIDRLNDNVLSVNQELTAQLAEMRKQRNEINTEFARQIERLRGEDSLQKRDIQFLNDGIKDIKATLAEIREASATISPPKGWAFGGEVTLESYEAFLKDAGVDINAFKGGAPVLIGPYVPPKN